MYTYRTRMVDILCDGLETERTDKMVNLHLMAVLYKRAQNKDTELLHGSWRSVLHSVIKIGGNLQKIFYLLTLCVTGSEFLIVHFWTWSDSSQPSCVSRRRGCTASAASFSRCYCWGSTQSGHLLPQTGEVHDSVSGSVVPLWNCCSVKGSTIFQKI